MKAPCAAGAAFTSPTAIIPTWTSGGCLACKSATNIHSCIKWPIFSKAWPKETPVSPTFRDALETQKVCDAVLASGKSGQWTDVK